MQQRGPALKERRSADTVSGNSSNASDSIKETENGSNASGITEAGGNSSNKQEHTGKQLAAVSGNGTLAQNGDAGRMRLSHIPAYMQVSSPCVQRRLLSFGCRGMWPRT